MPMTSTPTQWIHAIHNRQPGQLIYIHHVFQQHILSTEGRQTDLLLTDKPLRQPRATRELIMVDRQSLQNSNM